MVIKNLVDVVNQEFSKQTTIYNAQNAEARDKILEQYKKSVGYDSLKKTYDKAEQAKQLAEDKIKEAKYKINLKGLTISGNENTKNTHYNTPTEKERQIDKAVDRVQKLLDVVNTQGPDTIRNKIVSRLWVSTTVGEAMVILKAVLGNGIIPSLTVNEVKRLT